VFLAEDHVLTFRGDALPRMEVKDSADQIMFCEGELVFSEAAVAVFLKRGARIEAHLHRTGAAPRRVFVGRFDFVEVTIDLGKASRATFESRAIASTLVDDAFVGEHEGSIASFVDAISKRNGLRAETSYSDGVLVAWLNGKSSYGLLRLLAVNLGAFVRVRDDLVQLVSYEVAMKPTSPVRTVRLRPENVKTSRRTEGRRVRKRGEEK